MHKLTTTFDMKRKGDFFTFDFQTIADPPLPSREEFSKLVQGGSEGNFDDMLKSTAAMVASRIISAIGREWATIKEEMGKVPDEVDACNSTLKTLH
jgi:hypothetical protein